MNDRFRFRVFDKEKNEYIDGHMCVGQGGRCIIDANILQDYEYSSRYIIEQCTSLKDKNGNLIYEGDKVEITIFGSIGTNGGYVDSDEIYEGTVVWDRDCFFVKTDTDNMILFPHSEDCIEIIGNIHEQHNDTEAD